MVGDSRGHREDSPSKGIDGKASRKKNASDSEGGTGAGGGANDPKDIVMRAAGLGRLNEAQAKALSDLLSRMGLLGFDSRRFISVIVTNIALEESADKRTELALQLREYLEGDGLAKDLVPVLSGAFALG